MTKLKHLVLAAATLCGLIAPAAYAAGSSADAALIERGAYLARLGDCIACHTARNGKPFAGGLAIQTPIGRIYSTNITPDRDHGIGAWTYDDFAVLMRHGQTKAGYAVYPAMPYPSYSRVNDADMHALYAYFEHGVAPVAEANRANEIPWPLSMRWPLKIWRWMYAPTPEPFADVAGPDASAEHGAYLVEGLGHCGSCHTPRSVTLQEKALTGDGNAIYLAGGGAIDGWIAPSLRNEHGGGLANWNEQEIVEFLHTGRTARTASFGAMNDVIADSTQFMTTRDLQSIALYLKSLGAQAGNEATKPYAYDAHVASQLFVGNVPAVPGAQLYLDRCAACHKSNGKGNGKAFPALAGNPVLQTANPTSAIHIVLSGGAQPSTQTAPSTLTMAPYADILSDQQVADVVSFIQTGWGNTGGKATAAQVAKIRKGATPVEARGLQVAEPELHHAAPADQASGTRG
ncbi:mono/diheme cytochrome c family protein [Paraburkholderia sp. GAS199]|uniref:c-type cytochrome n=1 Tax=Paraburkholderia sp. GAS199 TaxID=3035126 RepID=UPI003D19CA5E